MKRTIGCALAFALLAIIAGACGGGSGGADVVSAPEPKQDLDQHLAAVNQAIAKNDCEANVEQQFTQIRGQPKGATSLPDPGAPATAAECPRSGSGSVGGAGGVRLSALKGLRLDALKESGPAAVSEGNTGPRFQGYGHFAVISVVDRDGSWRYLSFFQAEPQSAAPSPDADPGAVVDKLLASARSGDCDDADAIYDPLGRLAGGAGGLTNPGGAGRACRTVTDGELFAPSLKGTPQADVKPEELVTTRDISIWGVPTKEAYYAVFLSTPPHPVGAPPSPAFRVSDVVALTAVEPG